MKKKRNRIKNMAVVAGLLIAAMFVAVMPAQAYTVGLKVTDNNLNMLQYHAVWTPYSYGDLMLWPSLLDATCQKQKIIGNIGAVSVDDNQCNGLYYGECVSLVKALSKSNVPTTSSDNNHWTRGDNVMTSYFVSIQPGAAIATFTSGGSYNGHAAIFRGYYYNNIGQRIGILVWDQNYLPDKDKVVARHAILSKGTTYPTDTNNADNYYTVRVPG